MSKLFIRVAAALTLIYGALLATQTVFAYAPQRIQASCDATLLARSGQLTYLPAQNAWVSVRGDLFQLSACPALKDGLIARNQ